MKRFISISMAVIMLLGCVFVIASCGGKKTYKYSDVKITVDAGEKQSLIGSVTDVMKNSIAEQMKEVTLEIDGDKVTVKQGDEIKTLNCTRNGDRLEFSAKDLGELTEGMDNGTAKAYIIEKDGATMCMEAAMEEMGLSIGMKVEIIFK